MSLWQHCIRATRSGVRGVQPCWHVQQEKGQLSRNVCEQCGGPRVFARRGGVAERGDGSLTTSTQRTRLQDDDAEDSGYYSNVIHEDTEGSDSDCPLSPKSQFTAPLRLTQEKRHKRRASNQIQSLNRKPSWSPNLKRELSYDTPLTRRPTCDNIDSMTFEFEKNFSFASRKAHTAHEARRNSIRPERTRWSASSRTSSNRSSGSYKRRSSTLLHPSSPTEHAMPPLTHAYVVHIPDLSTTDTSHPSQYHPSTQHSQHSSHPSTHHHYHTHHHSAPHSHSHSHSHHHHHNHTSSEPLIVRRKASTLLHPSNPDTHHSPPHVGVTILSIPPQRRSVSSRDIKVNDNANGSTAGGAVGAGGKARPRVVERRTIEVDTSGGWEWK